MGQVIQFPIHSFFVEKVNLENHLDCEQILLEARVANRAVEEGNAIGKQYGWLGWVIVRDDNTIVDMTGCGGLIA